MIHTQYSLKYRMTYIVSLTSPFFDFPSRAITFPFCALLTTPRCPIRSILLEMHHSLFRCSAACFVGCCFLSYYLLSTPADLLLREKWMAFANFTSLNTYYSSFTFCPLLMMSTPPEHLPLVTLTFIFH